MSIAPLQRLIRACARLGSSARVRKLAGGLLGLWLTFAALAYWAGPPLAKAVLLEQLRQALGRDVSIEKIVIQPLNLSLAIEGLSVKAPDGREQLGFERLQLNLSSLSIAQAGIVADEVRLTAPRIAVTRLAEGRYDISDWLDKWLAAGSASATSLPRFSLNNIQVSDGLLLFDDRPKGTRHRIEAIGLDLPFVSSMPYKANVFVRPSFSAVVDGATLSLHGQLKPFAPSHESALALELADLDLSLLQPYLPSAFPLRLQAGSLNTTLRIAFSELASGVRTLSLSGKTRLRGLQTTDLSGLPWLALDQLDITLEQADPLKGLLTLGRLELQGLRLAQTPSRAALRVGALSIGQTVIDWPARRLDAAQMQASSMQALVVRQPDGQMRWLTVPQMHPAAATPADGPAASAPGPAWSARVRRLSIEDAALRFEDRTLMPAATQEMTDVRLTLDDLDTRAGQQKTFHLSAKVKPSGSIEASGALQLQPLTLLMKLETQALPVLPMQGYLAPYLNASLVQGLLSSAGALQIQQTQGKLRASYQGSLTLGQFRIEDKANSADFLKWKSLYVGDIGFQLDPARLDIGQVALSDFYARLILNPQGRLNLSEIVRSPEREGLSTQPAQPAGKQEALPVQIAKVTLQNGQVNFSDRFVRPAYSAQITRLAGSIQNLSSSAGTVAELDLRGSYAGNAPVHIAARLNPLADKKFLDLQAEVRSVDLVDFSPYSGKYAGYAIDKGKLSLNATYKLQERQLTAENRVFIDQLTFGEKVESPDATQLPVHLAIALLKNSRGEIDIQLPISGSLDDPQFSIGGLIFKVIANLFVKAVTSPFALLGSLWGEQQELSQIGFAPGSAQLGEPAVKTLQALAKALLERPALTLEITAGADRQVDTQGLQRAALARAMQAEKRKDLSKTTATDEQPQEVQIGPGEYTTYLRRAYSQARFPKPRNLIGLPKELPDEDMEKLMLTHLPVTEDDLRALAARRAQAAQTWLVVQGQVPLSRVFLLPIQTGAASGKPSEGSRNRADFSLR